LLPIFIHFSSGVPTEGYINVMLQRLEKDFFTRDVLEVAPALLGKILVRRFQDGSELQLIITETEAYRGEEDLACHASKGRTNRTEVMYLEGGQIYVYLIYGMYWMLNFVTSIENDPQAVLIRGVKELYGPGRLTKYLNIDKTFNGENLCTSNRLFICNSPSAVSYKTATRIGIDYAGEYWAKQPWRFIIE
jgi:DNA-3-methyladenine glycosylase